jgi:hypothetical protein
MISISKIRALFCDTSSYLSIELMSIIGVVYAVAEAARP